MKQEPQPTWIAAIYHAYLALVCGISLIVLMFTAGNILTTGVDIVLPPPRYVSATTEYNHETKREEPLAPEKLALREAEEAQRQAEQRQRDMLHALIYFLLSTSVFGYHWRLFKRSK